MNKKGVYVMQEKKYLKWYNKVGYGSGDIAEMLYMHSYLHLL